MTTLRTIVIAFVTLAVFGCSKKVIKAPIRVTPAPIMEISPEPRPEPLGRFGLKAFQAKVYQDNLETVYFELDSYKLSPGGAMALDDVVDVLYNAEGVSVHVMGGACPLGTYDHNQLLGLNRGLSLKAYIVGQGIEQDRVVVSSRGEDGLVTTKAADYWMNRNATIELL